MYRYKIGYGTYEESECDYLLHEERYTNEQIKNFVHESVLCVLKMSSLEEIEFYSTYQDVHSKVVNLFVNIFGFRRIEVESEWDCNGWASLYNSSENDCTANVELTKVLNANGFGPDRHMFSI